MNLFHCTAVLLVVLLPELSPSMISASSDPLSRRAREAPVDPQASSLPPSISKHNVSAELASRSSTISSSTSTGGPSQQPPQSVSGTNNTNSGKRIRPNASVDFNSRPADGVMVIKPKGPDLNFVPPKNQPSESLEGGSDSDDDEQVLSGAQPKFDDKAVERALIVASIVGGMIMVYLGVKFALLKKKKVSNKRYGRIESEIDLLDEMEDGGTDEEEELFDINSTRRSQY